MAKQKGYEIFITTDKLADFASLNITWADIIGDMDPLLTPKFTFEANYPMTLEDLENALLNAYDMRIDEFLYLWWMPLNRYFFDALSLRELFVPAPGAAGNVSGDIPRCEEDMIASVLDQMDIRANEYIDRFTSISSDEQLGAAEIFPNAKDYFDFDALLSEIRLFNDNINLPVTAREFSDRQMTEYITARDNSLVLNELSDEDLELFVKFTDTLCDKNDFAALRIKAYALYGGNRAYAQDFKESQKYLEILWRDFNFGYAANTLGYIYYYGRTNGGVPDYERAYHYYAIGNVYGITESRYKLADMYFNGYYVAKSREFAHKLIRDIYNEERYYFEDGDYGCSFADVAFRMGRFFIDDIDELSQEFKINVYGVAYKFLLEARLAIDLRMQNDRQFGDEKVKANIEKLIAEIQDAIPTIHMSQYTTHSTMLIEEFCASHKSNGFYLKIKENAGSYRVTITRRDFYDAPPGLSIVTMPWFDISSMEDTLSFRIPKDETQIFGALPNNDFFTDIDVNTTADDLFFTFSTAEGITKIFRTSEITYTRPRKKKDKT